MSGVRRRSLSWRSAGLIGLVGALVASAFIADGYKAAKLDLNEAGVWATNGTLGLAGRVNQQINQIEVLTPLVSAGVDVLQHGRDVMVVDPGKSLKVVEVATANLGAAIELTADSSVTIGGSQVVVVDHKSGRVWARPFTSIGALDLAEAKPTAKLGAGALVAANDRGGVVGVSVTKRTISVVRSGSGEPPQPTGLEVSDEKLQVALVGSTPVVLAPSSGKLQVGTRVVDLARFGATPQLQEGDGGASSVLVATDTSLVEVPLDEGEPKVIAEDGTGLAARPVHNRGCSFAAWGGGSGAVTEAIVCENSDSQGAVDLKPGTTLRFRVNGPNVILNSLEDGGTIRELDGEFVKVDNWEELLPTKQSEEREREESELDEQGDLKCDAVAENRPPVAENDTDLGARPGAATILKVLGNDRDPDCDVLVITEVRDIRPANSAVVVPVDRGHAVQFTSTIDFTGPVTFTYVVNDGRSTTGVEATVTVTVRGLDEVNGRPTQLKSGSRVTVGRGESVTYNVLDDFVDPDGDPMVLTGASADSGSGGTVRSQTDGSVTFVDDGAGVGTKQLSLLVSDGRDTGPGVLVIEVVDSVKPTARNDHAVGLAGQPVTIDVLANDADAGGETIRLSGVDQIPSNASVVPDTTAGLVVFQTDIPGPYRFRYTMGAGGESAQAWVRVDITDPGENQPPVAVRDVTSISVGGTALIDVVANDTDPNGDVLVVQSISIAPGSGVTGQLLEHRAIRVSASRIEPVPVTVEYVLSDGQAEPVTGQLIVAVSAGGQLNQPPVARDDLAVVRAGDVVTVPVLGNDFDPDGDVLTVEPAVTENRPEGTPPVGVEFVDQTRVRFVAGDTPGSVSITYSVTDAVGQTASALVRITVLASDAANQPPIPRSLDARAFAGTTVDIVVPVLGVDPDGDSVTMRLDRAPTKGRILSTDDIATCQCFHYEAFEASVGTDTFTYLATDGGGLSGEATIRVGVTKRPATNQAPAVVDDTVNVRPGGQVAVPVLDNDSDPDGDPVTIDPDLELVPSKGVSAKVVNGKIVVKAGEPTTATFAYSVVDGRGGRGSGYLTVVVTDQAKPKPPIARDDVATPVKASATTVDVDVLENDEDPDGPKSDLTVVVDDPGAKVAGGTVTIKLGTKPRILPYRVTDLDEQSAMAIIRVPALPSSVNQPPVVRSGKDVLTVDAGQQVSIDVNDIAEDPEGKPLLLTQADKVVAANGTVAPTGPDAFTFSTAEDFAGAASVTFEVTDGDEPTDSAGARATVTIEVTVVGKINTPPTFAAAAVSLAAGDEPVRIALTQYVTDPDPGDQGKIAFGDLTGDGNGVTASLDGDTLTVSADESVKKGTNRILDLTVTDGTNPPVPASIKLDFVASARPLAKANDDTYEAQSGKLSTFNVLANDQAPPTLDPLKIVDATVGANLGEVKFTDTEVTFTPSPVFVGTADLTYTVNDKLGEDDRKVVGTIHVTVKDRPAAPSAPTVAEYGNKFVVLTWQAPVNNGDPIDKFEISWNNNTAKTEKCQAATTCKLDASDGLVNGQKYTFVVRAHNKIGVGWSDPSPASGEVTPDTRPNAATVAPTVKYLPTYGSGELEVSWPAAAPAGPWINEGTPIVNYELQVTPPPTTGQPPLVAPGTTTVRITGLVNGQDYNVRVRARNSAVPNNGWSELSPASSPAESPATKPDQPIAPTATRVDSPIGKQISVTWTAPKANAKAMLGYKIVVYRDGVATPFASTQPIGAATMTQVLGADDAHDYQYGIIATNKAGDSIESPKSVKVRAFSKPARITSVTASAPATNSTINLAFSVPDDRGEPIDTYQIVVTSSDSGAGTGPRWLPYSGSGAVVTGLTNGKNYTFTVAGCNQGQRVDYCGDASPGSNSESPYGPPGNPTVSANDGGGNTVSLSWAAPASNGRPVTMEVNIDGGGWSAVAASGSSPRNTGCEQGHSIQARAVSMGLYSAVVSASRSAPACPPPPISVTMYRGSENTKTSGTCTANRCYIPGARLRNFAPNSTHTLNCSFGPANSVPDKSIQVDGNGNWDGETYCYAGNTTVGIRVDGTDYDVQGVSWWH